MDGKIVLEKEIVCYVRDYRITKHFHGFPPEYKVLDAPVYRVSQNNHLMTHVSFNDLDTAVEYAVGFVIRDTMYSVQAKLKETMDAIDDQQFAETVHCGIDGQIIYPAQT